MEALAERLYQRHRRHFPMIVVGLVLAFIAIWIGIPLTLMLPVIADVRIDAGRTVVAFVATLGVIGIVAPRAPSYRRLRDWLERGGPPEPGRWEDSLRAPGDVVRWGFVSGAPVAVATIVMIIGPELELTAEVAVSFGLFILIGALGLRTVIANGLELVLRPLRAELSAQLGIAVPPRHRSTMARRLLSGAIVAGTVSAWIGATVGLGVDADEPIDRVVLVLAAGLLGMVYVALTFWGAIATPMLRPVADLTAATERVRAGAFDQPVSLTSSDELGDLVLSFNEMQRGLQERATLHAAFGTYVDPDLAERLLAVGDDAFAGEDVTVTVFFVDVRGFTTWAETVSAAIAVARLNDLFSLVVPIVRAHQGHPNRYLGDGMLAVFGAPEPVADHADRALAAAREIQTAVWARFGADLRVGIGLNTGEVIAGAMGGGGKLEYTVIGDPVNVAARVEQLTKDTGDGILLTQATYDALTDASGLQRRGERHARGKAQPITVFAAT